MLLLVLLVVLIDQQLKQKQQHQLLLVTITSITTTTSTVTTYNDGELTHCVFVLLQVFSSFSYIWKHMTEDIQRLCKSYQAMLKVSEAMLESWKK